MKIRKIKFVKTPIKEYKPKFFGKSVIEGIEAVPINLPPDYYTKKFHEYESKLKKYKDIEEDLRIDLITLFKALKNGCYIKSKTGEIVFYCENELAAISDSLEVYIGIDEDWRYIPYKDYGKTWALTKEELE